MDQSEKNWWLLLSCWIIAFISALGSLFFSEVMEFPPCQLCWYQRIAMYPLVIIFLMALIKERENVFAFSFPLVAIGWLIATYHNLLHLEIIPEAAAPCREDVSCSTVYLDWFGFITIPLMSWVAFSVIAFILYVMKKKESHASHI